MFFFLRAYRFQPSSPLPLFPSSPLPLLFSRLEPRLPKEDRKKPKVEEREEKILKFYDKLLLFTFFSDLNEISYLVDLMYFDEVLSEF